MQKRIVGIFANHEWKGNCVNFAYFTVHFYLAQLTSSKFDIELKKILLGAIMSLKTSELFQKTIILKLTVRIAKTMR
jgi:hypothetical protein